MTDFVGRLETNIFYSMKFFSKISRSLGAIVHKKDSMIEAVYGIWGRKKGAVYPMEVAAVFRCVRLLSDAIAAMPLRLMDRASNGVYYPQYRSSLYSLFAVEPNPRISAHEFKRTAIRRMLLDGVVYMVPLYAESGVPSELHLAFKQDVAYDKNAKTYTITDTDITGFPGGAVYKESEIIVLRAMSRDGVEGEGITDYARKVIELAAAGDLESEERINNGGAPRMIISEETGAQGIGGAIESSLGDYSSKIETELQQGKRAIVIRGGFKAQQVGASSAEMQLQAMREFAVLDICRFFGVPPIYVFANSAGNYKTAEMAGVDFLVNTLEPILCMIENELMRKLIPRDLWGLQRFEFDRDARTAADSSTRANYLKTMLECGAYTVNEIRKRNNQPAVDGGDSPLVSANLKPLNELSNQNNNANQPD